MPTYNNNHFTLRFLKYYNQFSYDYNLIIADGSKNKIDKRISLELNKNKNIKYLNLSKKPYSKDVFKRFSYILKYIKTPYLKVIANDDFFINSTCIKCVNFLDKNKNYDIAGGYLLDFKLKDNLYGKIFSLRSIYKITSNESKNTIHRLIKYMWNVHSTTHFVYRTKIFKNSIRNSVKEFNNDIEFRELYFELLNYGQSRMKMFDNPIALHQSHNNSEGGKREDIIDLLSKKDFLSNLQKINSQINKRFNLKNNFNFVNMYFKNIVSNEVKTFKKKYYHGFKDIIKLTNDLFTIKFKRSHIDNYNNFQKSIKNKITKKEINKIQDFLLNSYKV